MQNSLLKVFRKAKNKEIHSSFSVSAQCAVKKIWNLTSYLSCRDHDIPELESYESDDPLGVVDLYQCLLTDSTLPVP